MFDEGYDAAADAFLFGKVILTALSTGSIRFITTVDEVGCFNNAKTIIPAIGSVSICVQQKLLLGDVNLDGAINLLDVTPFVKILSNARYQAEADINQDGAVGLINVPFAVRGIAVELNTAVSAFLLLKSGIAMKTKTAMMSLLSVLVLANCSVAQFDYDYFWSNRSLGEGAVNEPQKIEVQVGQVVPLYLYWTTNGPADSDISAGCGVDVSTSEPGVIRFESAESYNIDILVQDIVVGTRWEDIDGGSGGGYGGGGFAGPAFDVQPDFIDGLIALTVGNNGILEFNNGSNVFLDEGYDVDADAFIFGQLVFTAVAPGNIELITVLDEIGCVDGATALEPVIASFGISVTQGVLLGDVNRDGDINLLDVTPFVQILSNLGYQQEADINQDGVVDLVDVPLFEDLLLN